MQHAELAVQESYLPRLQKAAATKQAKPSQVAILEDRINVRNKRPQRYASQLCFVKGGGYAWQPIENEDEAAIDAVRETAGLGTIKGYAANFKIECVPPSKKACDKQLLAFLPDLPEGFTPIIARRNDQQLYAETLVSLGLRQVLCD